MYLCISGRPESVFNCSQLNHSADTLVVQCQPGFDGGLTQLFTIELRYLKTNSGEADNEMNQLEDAVSGGLVRNVTLSKPYFEIGHLESGVRFEAKVFASNRKGRSTPVTLRVSTLKRPEGKRMATIASGSGRPKEISSTRFISEELLCKLHFPHFLHFL